MNVIQGKSSSILTLLPSYVAKGLPQQIRSFSAGFASVLSDAAMGISVLGQTLGRTAAGGNSSCGQETRGAEQNVLCFVPPGLVQKDRSRTVCTENSTKVVQKCSSAEEPRVTAQFFWLTDAVLLQVCLSCCGISKRWYLVLNLPDSNHAASRVSSNMLYICTYLFYDIFSHRFFTSHPFFVSEIKAEQVRLTAKSRNSKKFLFHSVS